MQQYSYVYDLIYAIPETFNSIMIVVDLWIFTMDMYDIYGLH